MNRSGRFRFFATISELRPCVVGELRYSHSEMERENATIEAEVVEIDGVTVDSRPDDFERSEKRVSWYSWQGKVKTLDARWWPLWLILGFIALVLIVAIGMCAAVIGLIYLMIKFAIKAILSLIVPSSRDLYRPGS